MELKYYLRGLGLGIIVTAIIMGITASRDRTMTDDEIIARAKQLGMIEDRVLTEAATEDSDIQDNKPKDEGAENSEENNLLEDGIPTQPESESKQNTPEEDAQPDAVSASGEAEAMMSTDDTAAAAVPDDGETGQETPADQEGPGAQDSTESQGASEQADETEQSRDESPGTSVVITVGNGDGSYTVSKKLEDAGAVSSASVFDTFLCENGYDKKIRAGNYTIPPDASDEQIAKMITGQRTE